MILSDMCVCHDDNLLYNTITYHFLYIKSIYYIITYFFCISRIQELTALTNVFMSN